MFEEYPCSQCEYITAIRNNLSLHLWTVHLIDKNTHMCPFCDYFTENQNKLRNHLKLIHCPPRANKNVLAAITKFLALKK